MMGLFRRKKDVTVPTRKPTPGVIHAVAFVAFVAMLVAAAVLGIRQRTEARGYVTIGDGIRVRTTVASNELSRSRGLSGTPALASDEGMLFIFDEPAAYRFWMKDMLFPIDILWIADGRIVDITTDLPVPVPGEELPTFAPRIAVDRALEVPAGFARAHGLRLGLPVEYHVDSRDAVR